ncbi:zinc finger transcriptional activator [Microsporum ferrugineum]
MYLHTEEPAHGPMGGSFAMSTAATTGKVHKRAYQACIPCRERRVRCDLGSVDQPHQGPCGRCRRERKLCHFSATRGRKKGAPASTPAPSGPSDLITGTTATATTATTVSATAAGITPTRPWEESTIAVAGTPASLSGVITSRPGESSASPIAVPAAIKREHSLQHVLSQDTPRPATRGDKTAEKLLRDAAYTSHDALNLLFEAGRHSERVARSDHNTNGAPSSRLGPIPTRELRPSAAPSLHDPAPDFHPWSNLRFVRTGLITAEEAFDLVNYFHTYLAPFTPIASSSFQDPSMHSELLEEEPILAMTILMLASRYMKLSGPGSVSRSYMVHERLWQHLQGMISRMIFGQEQFTGGTHTHDPPEASNLSTHEYPLAGSNFGSLRTLGSCEALLLLSEWHPRSLHVPAGDDGDSIVVKDDVRRTIASTAGIGGRIRIDWLEPVWRSDRMCWSMLGNALALAVELGIFDEYDNTTIGARESRRDIWNNPLSSQRAHLVQHLLWVYLTQTSGRLVSHHDTGIKHGDTIRCWVGVASLMKRGNELLFPSRERTREIVKTGEYLAVLRVLNPLLREWQKEFDRAKLSRQMRSILTIEFGYVRVYIHSVALQAVIENYYHVMHEGGGMPEASLLEPFEGNREYFMEVIASAKSILQTVVEDLLPDNHLKHVPIRTYSRILAGAMFCLKATSLGAKDFETSGSLSLVERTADALCTCVVDDVHLSNRFGELLHALAASLRNRVVQMTASEQPSGSITPNTLAPHRQYAQSFEGDITNNQMMVCGPGSYHELSMGRMGLEDHSIADPVYDNCQAGSSSATAAGTPAYYAMNPASGLIDQVQNDPLINFAGLGPNQLGWSGGQDFFDMLGPLLDVQYEQYK